MTLLNLVSERLKIFQLDLATDKVASTNDGAAVMKRFGQISPISNQLCYSHAIHLAVTDILYKNINPVETDVDATREDSETDEFEDKYEKLDPEVMDQSRLPIPTLVEDYKDLISEIRKIRQFFLKSPVRNSILQNFVKEKHGKELN